ncbi:MAG TPA: hypothetical protein VF337_09950 [Candidatus Limnocylindrales bacterium]
MDDVSAQDSAQDETDLEAAAALAQLATALSDAAAPNESDAPPVDETAVQAPAEPSAQSPRRFRRPRMMTAGLLRVPSIPPLARTWLRRATVVALSVAIVLGLSAATPLPKLGPPAPTAALAAASPTAPGPSPSQSPSASPAASTSEAPSPSPSPTLEWHPTATTTHTSPIASITFHNLMLDSATDPTHTARTFTFTSDGPGIVSASIVATSPSDSTTICIKAEDGTDFCQSGATPELNQETVRTHSLWTVTLVSANASTPTVDVALAWPADSPSISIIHGRFQGSPNPDSLRTLAATFRTRAGGPLSLIAAWPHATADAILTLTDISGSRELALDSKSYAAAESIAPGYSHNAVAAHTYKIVLYNEGANVAPTDLAATIAFP